MTFATDPETGEKVCPDCGEPEDFSDSTDPSIVTCNACGWWDYL